MHLNLNQKRKKIEFGRLPVKPTGKLVRTVCTATFEFKFDFNRFGSVSDQTGPVYRYRTPLVWPDRSVRVERRARRRQPTPTQPSAGGRAPRAAQPGWPSGERSHSGQRQPRGTGGGPGQPGMPLPASPNAPARRGSPRPDRR